jgi:apolipoprotein D and lipocalin family protein
LRGLIAVLALAGCVAAGSRDASVPITSIVSFDPALFVGRWHVVEAIKGTDCAAYDYAPSGGGLAVTGYCAGGVRQGEAHLAGPGRLTQTLGGRPEELWVLWVDADYRTAVIGTPSGRVGMVLNRVPDIPPDRLRAAHEVMDWNGYDVADLRTVR